MWLKVLFVLCLLLLVPSLHATLPRLDWRQCVIDIPQYYTGINTTIWKWLNNPCGFREISAYEVPSLMGTSSSWFFFGDSTALRSFSQVENSVLNISQVITKVAERPSLIVHGFGTMAGSPVRGNVTFVRMLYLSTAQMIIDEINKDQNFDKNDAVVMYLTFGNHDLNWKLHLNKPMPGLEGPTQDFSVAKKYWAKFSDKFVKSLREAIVRRNKRNPGKLFLICREQFMPNCNSHRYDPRRKSYRDCRGTVRKAVRWYRKVLQPLLWELNIPVMPTDFLFANNYKACAIGDGIHLDLPCKKVEMEIIWNIAALMKRECVSHGMSAEDRFSDIKGLEEQEPYFSEVLPESVKRKSLRSGCGDTRAEIVAPQSPMKDAGRSLPRSTFLGKNILTTSYVEMSVFFAVLVVFIWWSYYAYFGG